MSIERRLLQQNPRARTLLHGAGVEAARAAHAHEFIERLPRAYDTPIGEHGALASQLGSVTVSAVPDEQSPEVGGLQNTATNLGASLGTALAGSILTASLTTSFLQGIQANPAVPPEVSAQASVELAAGIPLLSDADLRDALEGAGVSEEMASAVVEENAEARLFALRAALAVIAVVALLALFFSGPIPTAQPGSSSASAAGSPGLQQ